jgi:hypothetical protein
MCRIWAVRSDGKDDTVQCLDPIVFGDVSCHRDITSRRGSEAKRQY